jgi:hypothetical protein
MVISSSGWKQKGRAGCRPHGLGIKKAVGALVCPRLSLRLWFVVSELQADLSLHKNKNS